MNIFIDTETTGKINGWNVPVEDVEKFPRLVQLGYIITDDLLNVIEEYECLLKPVGFEIPAEATAIHGIATERALAEGKDVGSELSILATWIHSCDQVIGHNVDFDADVIGAEFFRIHKWNIFSGKTKVCTMKLGTDFCQLPKTNPKARGTYKYPTLRELYEKLFYAEMGAAHTALQDIRNTALCYGEMVERGIIGT